MSKMLDSHRKVLAALAENEGYFFGFASLMYETKMERREVRRIVRHLARRGLTEYAKGLWNEDGEPCGSGYRITDQGMSALTPSNSETP
jgi:cation transport regulator ChaC